MNRDARVTTWKSYGAQFFKCFKWWSEQILIKDRCAATKWYHGNSVRVLGSYIWFSKLAELKRTPIGQLFVIAAEVKTEIPDRMAEGCPKHNPWKGYTECHPVAAIFFCHPFAAIFFCHPFAAIFFCHPFADIFFCHPFANLVPYALGFHFWKVETSSTVV